MAVEVEEIFARFGVKVDKGSFSAADGMLGTLKNMALAAGAALAGIGLGSIVRGWVTETIAFAGELNDLSTALDLSVTRLQEWTHGVQMGGAAESDLTAGIRTLGANLQAAAADGMSPAAKALRAMGVSWQMIKAQDVEGSLLKIADATASGDASLAETMDVLGKSALKLRPWLAEGSSGIAQLSEEAHALGRVLEKETINRLDDVGDAWDRIGMVVTALKREVVLGLLPAIETTTVAAEDLVRESSGPIAEGIRATFAGLTQGWEWLVGVVEEGMQSLLGNVWIQDMIGVLSESFSYVADLLATAWDAVVAATRGAIKVMIGVVKIFVGIADGIWRALRALGVLRVLLAALTVAWALLKMVIASVGGVLEGIGDLFQWVGDLALKLGDALEAAFDASLGWVLDVLKDIGEWLDDTWDKISNVGETAADIWWRIRHPFSGPRPEQAIAAAEMPGVPQAAIIGGVNPAPVPRIDLGPWASGENTSAPGAVTINVNGVSNPEAVAAAVDARVKNLFRKSGASVRR